MGLRFNLIVFPQLLLQRLPKTRPHPGIQYTSDPNLSHLCRFQDGTQYLLAVFHNASLRELVFAGNEKSYSLIL